MERLTKIFKTVYITVPSFFVVAVMSSLLPGIVIVGDGVGVGLIVGSGVGMGVGVGVVVGDGEGVGVGINIEEADISSTILPPVSQVPICSTGYPSIVSMISVPGE